MECTEERIIELKSRTVEMAQYVQNRENRLYEHEQKYMYFALFLHLYYLFIATNWAIPSYNSLCLAGYIALNRYQNIFELKKMNRASETCGMKRSNRQEQS